MFLMMSKLLPLFVYPLGLACVLLLLSLLLRRESRWPRRLVWLALILLWLGSTRWTANALARSLEWRYLPPAEIPEADVIVLLGGGARPLLYPRQISEVSEAGDRMLYAAWLYHQGIAGAILVSGGHAVTNTPAGPAEWESMADILEMLGVPREAIWQENESRNTYENAIYSKKILDEQGIQRVLLVTSATHMPRSVRIFEKQGIEVIPAPADFLVTQADWDYMFEADLGVQLYNLLPSAGAMNLTEIALKEYMGIVVYWLRGYV